jgi:hypothetical protein
MSAVVIKTRTQSENIDALNRKAVYASADVDNGTAVSLAFSATEGDEVFVATLLQSGMTFNIGRKEPIIIAKGSILESEQEDAWLLEVTVGGWMAIAPEVNKDVIGEVYKGLDPRRFTNVAGVPFDVVKLVEGDIIQVSKDFFEANYDPDTVTGATAVSMTSGKFRATT